MEDYYKVLGLKAGADEKEIKRAYFKLVRRYTPEENPERFQEIREAYEILTAKQNESNELALEFPDHPYAEGLREQMMHQMEMHDYRGAIASGEEALYRFGESEGFLYFLAKSQLYAGNSGKAAKNFERLAELFPEKLIYQRSLATAYMERGYGKKAYQAFQDAYSRGCRHVEFMLLFSENCAERGNRSQALVLLRELLDITESEPEKYFPEILCAYSGIVTMGDLLSSKNLGEILRKFCVFVHQERDQLEVYWEELLAITMLLVRAVGSDFIDNELLETVQAEVKSCIPKDKKENWQMLERDLERQKIHKDNRIPEWMKAGFETCLAEDEWMDMQLVRFGQRDLQLCMLEEWPQIQTKIQIIKDEYPIYYKKLSEYVEMLETSNDLNRLRDRLKKDYDRREQDISGGFYYQLHPERRKVHVSAQWDSDRDGTYVRSQAKIGRNDPCPCGSGKKYKNCCGRG